MVKKLFKDRLRDGYIRPSSSNIVSPVVLAAKRTMDGQKETVRPAIDYRLVNLRTTYDYYPIPLQEKLLDKMYAKKYKSSIDL